jgi:hypothetical protein
LLSSLVGEIENSIITHPNAPAVAIFQLFAPGWKGLAFQGEKHASHALLLRCGKPG